MSLYTAIIIIVWIALVVLTILVNENDRINKKEKSVLFFTYLMVALSSLAEWLGVYFSGNKDIPVEVLKTIKFFDYALTPIAGGIIVLQFNTKTIFKKVLFAVCCLNIIYQIIACFTGWMTIINDSHIYDHGPGYFVYIIIYAIIIALTAIDFIVYGSTFRKKNRISLFSIYIFIIAGVSLQEIFGGEVRTAYLSLTFGLVLLFIHFSEFSQLRSDDKIQEQMIKISIDPLTGLLSRYSYKSDLQALRESHELPDDLVVFSIDINGLKWANDNLGHNAGDELISGAANCIAHSFNPYGKSYRTGGDEFIVLANIEEDKINPLLERLNEKINSWKGKDVESLSISIGYAEAKYNKELPIEKLIASADKKMYEMKDEFYRTHNIDRRLR